MSAGSQIVDGDEFVTRVNSWAARSKFDAYTCFCAANGKADLT